MISKSRHRKPIAAINQKTVQDRKLRAELTRFFGCFEVICLLATASSTQYASLQVCQGSR
jgi:hypothetical protein